MIMAAGGGHNHKFLSKGLMISMNILAFETSCDETAVALVRDGRHALSSVISSQVELHALYGGVVPEVASRRHIETIVPLTEAVLSACPEEPVDAVAVTAAPGLIGALLVGVGFAKAFALARGLPLVPVHHIRAHIAGAYLSFPELEPPFLAVVVSGGHTLLMDVRDYTDMLVLGSTVDDAAGEAFDKVARALGLGYPGGPAISKLAEKGDNSLYVLPRAMQGELDMSFSGLKTAVIQTAHNAAQRGQELDRASMAACFERAVCETIVPRAEAALGRLKYRRVVLAGGVAANRALRGAMAAAFGGGLFVPPMAYCGDNAAMVGSQGYYELMAGNTSGWGLNGRATMPVGERF